LLALAETTGNDVLAVSLLCGATIAGGLFPTISLMAWHGFQMGRTSSLHLFILKKIGIADGFALKRLANWLYENTMAVGLWTGPSPLP
jgi:fucose permease